MESNQKDYQLRDIIRQKRQLTFGDIPPNFHMIATALGSAEGIVKYGFDNSFKALIDKRNWNLTVLGGSINRLGEIVCDNKPRLSVYRVVTEEAYELHVLPWARNQEMDDELIDHPHLDFKTWKPSSMKIILRIPGLTHFMLKHLIKYDDADFALLKCAHYIVEDFIDMLSGQFNIQKVYGPTVRGFYEYALEKYNNGEGLYLPRTYETQNQL